MEKEARQTPKIIAKQLQTNERIMQEICKKLRQNPSPFAMTIGRGSSDHACTYAKYLIETATGLVTASAAPSIVSIYNSKLNLKNALVIGISQSGKSPDICNMMAEAKKQSPIIEGVVAVDRTVPGPTNAPDVFVRIYRPKNGPDVLPALLWIDGGGYVLGSVEAGDLREEGILHGVGDHEEAHLLAHIDHAAFAIHHQVVIDFKAVVRRPVVNAQRGAIRLGRLQIGAHLIQ